MRGLLAGLALCLSGLAQTLPWGGELPAWWFDRTGLPREVVAVIPVEVPQRVLFIFVYIDERALNSNIRPERKEVLSPFLGENAVLVWAYSEQWARYDPLSLRFSQGEAEFRPSREDFLPIDGDFLSGWLQPGRPAAAVIVLGSDFTSTQPIEVHYGEEYRAVIPLTAQEP